jgi:hypothetical protein
MISLTVFIAALIIVAKYVTANSGVYFEKPSVKITASKKNLISKPAQSEPELAYAIVIMPKSYRSMLKQFSNHPLARNIQIVPADMEWREGAMVVQPKVRRKPSNPDAPVKADTTPKKTKKFQTPLAKSKNSAINTAIIGVLVAGASQKRMSY